MEIPESGYLFALAQIAITFAGFTALFMMLRQAIGGKSTPYDLFATRNYLFLSFLIVFGGMLPSVLSAFHLTQQLVWRIASLAVGVPLLVFLVSYPFRRRAVTGVRLPPSIWPQQIIFTTAVAVLFANAFGLFGEPVGPYMLGTTLILFDLFYAILLTLGMVFGAHPLGPDRHSKDRDKL